MANPKLTPAGSSASASSNGDLSSGLPAQDVTSGNSVNPNSEKGATVLPDDMAGWLSTQQVAEYLGISRRRFQDFAIQQSLPKRKIGAGAYYAPDVVDGARRKWQKIKSQQNAPQKSNQKSSILQKSAEKSVERTGTARQQEPGRYPNTNDDFYSQALTLVGQIVHHKSRAR